MVFDKPVRLIAAPAAFKGSLSAKAAAQAMAAGLAAGWPEAQVEALPVADGGEGTVEALVAATGGQLIRRRVTGPLGDPVEALFGLLGGEPRTAVIEMAAASGLVLVPPERRNPWHTTTRGTGELIRAALDLGARRIVVGIGGSATNDGGAGMARALGVRLLDGQGREIPEGGGGLGLLERIELAGLDARLAACDVLVACDVDNPLVGPQGASHVYGPQKGADPEMVRRLDANLARLAEVIARDLGISVADMPGAGAAGGLGAGLVAFAGGRLRRGIEIVLQAMEFETRVQGALMVVTGEGSIDRQTAFGKAPAGVAQAARRAGVPLVVALAGVVGHDLQPVYAGGIRAAFSIVPGPMSLEEAMAQAGPLVEAAANRLARLVSAAIRGGIGRSLADKEG